MTSPDSITVIRSRSLRLAKAVHADGRIADYDQARTIDLYDVPVAGLNDIRALLLRLLPRPNCAVVFGGIADRARTRRVRRLAYPDPETGDQATLRPVPHQWCAFDMDGIPRPDDVPAADLATCAALAIETLPPAFHPARCIVQASASHGLKPGCRLRLWYWLNRLTTGAELGFWLDPKRFPVDPCTFRPAQPIYVASPVFIGRTDHLPCRIADIPGAPAVTVPPQTTLKRPPLRPASPLPNKMDAGAGGYAFAALTNAAVRVHRAGIGQRHFTILREARGLARFVNAGLLTLSDIKTTLRDAGMNTGKPEDEIESIVTWAIEHPSGGTLPEGAVR